MQVYGESQLVQAAPYAHLGYSAASPLELDARAGGVLLIMAGALMALKLGLGKTAAGVWTHTLMLRGRILSGIGFTVLLVGLVLVLLKSAE